MKLEDWWFNQKSVSREELSDRTRAKGLYVIGTCGDCRWWNSNKEQFPFKQFCYHRSGYVYQTHKDFGCIHFEEKG